MKIKKIFIGIFAFISRRGILIILGSQTFQEILFKIIRIIAHSSPWTMETIAREWIDPVSLASGNIVRRKKCSNETVSLENKIRTKAQTFPDWHI